MTEILFARYTDVQTLLAGSLRFDIAQSLTTVQQQQVWANLSYQMMAANGAYASLTTPTNDARITLSNQLASSTSNTATISLDVLSSTQLRSAALIQANLNDLTDASRQSTLNLITLVGGALALGLSITGGASGSPNVSIPGALSVGSLANGTQIVGVAYASLPASPAAGMIAYVTDSTTNTWGATISGSGGDKVMAWYNGTNWTVMGK